MTTFAKIETNNKAESVLAEESKFDINCESAVLMDSATGEILYSKNEKAARSPASVTKIMTLLLVAEAIDSKKISLTDTVSVSKYAAEMGGSQVFLEEGEKITVEDLLKSTIIASANDSAVALAELVAGSNDAFVRKMNAKAIELGLSSTNFENVTGLDDTTKNHVTSALDIAIMSRELIKHDIILKYSSLWQDSIRDGKFTLTNTNRLVRYYDGCTGLKTGSTDKAGYCVSTTAKRDNMHLIAVIMGAETRDIRNACAKTLLDFGFSNYSLYRMNECELGMHYVRGGKTDSVMLMADEFNAIIPKGASVELKYNLPDALDAKVTRGDAVGEIEFYVSGELIGKSKIWPTDNVEKIGYFDIVCKLFSGLFPKIVQNM